MSEFYDGVLERLIRYARIDTQSKNGVSCVPTTAKQFHLKDNKTGRQHQPPPRKGSRLQHE